MRIIKICLVVFFITLRQLVCSQNFLIDSTFCGRWINMQYENALNQQLNKQILSSITPQYIFIDSLGVCTVHIRFEQKFILGSPKNIKQFGSLQQLVFRKELFISQIKDAPKFIAFTYPNNSVSIVFKKMDK